MWGWCEIVACFQHRLSGWPGIFQIRILQELKLQRPGPRKPGRRTRSILNLVCTSWAYSGPRRGWPRGSLRDDDSHLFVGKADNFDPRVDLQGGMLWPRVEKFWRRYQPLPRGWTGELKGRTRVIAMKYGCTRKFAVCRSTSETRLGQLRCWCLTGVLCEGKTANGA